MSHQPLHVLILCTGNSARSILAECIMNRMAAGRVVAHSAGSRPKGRVAPLARALLEREGYETGALRSKSWDEFGVPDAPEIDVVITVCDGAAEETCPVWPGAPLTAHWGIPDPAAARGADAAPAFELAYQRLLARIEAFLALPIDTLDKSELRRGLAEIGRLA